MRGHQVILDGDTLFVRVFVNYFDDAPTAPRATCTAATTGNATRTTTCNLQSLCLQTDVGNTNDWRINSTPAVGRRCGHTCRC